jgi:TRAP-type C4-dicarboxylate transport system permease small subunit
VEIFTQRLPLRFKRLLDGLMTLLTALLLLFLTWQTADYAYEFTLVRETVQTAYFTIPTWPSRWFVPVGLGLMALIALLQAVLTLCGQRRSDDAGN